MAGVRQGGSILNFIIVAVVLVGLLAAGIYVVRQVTQSSPEEGIATQTQEEESEGLVEAQSPKEEKSEETMQELPGIAKSSAEELPRTGSAEVIGGVLAVGMLSLAVAYYLRSRRVELPL